jgi:hypothetical protein
MIKRYVVIFLLLITGLCGRAQSLSFDELKNLTNMTGDQLHNYLLVSKSFKPAGKRVYGGRSFEQFRSNRNDPSKAETLSLRAAESLGENMVRQVIYFSLRAQDIKALLVQIKQSGMTMIFQGSDKYKDIYRFDNSLFMAVISLNFDKSSGTIQLEEK